MNPKHAAIIEAAVALIDREGIAVPTARVAAEAKVSNGTLFNYFSTKQDLIDGVYLALKQELLAALDGPAGESAVSEDERREGAAGADALVADSADAGPLLADSAGEGAVEELLRVVWVRWISWAIEHPARHRVAGLLQGAGLVSPAVTASAEAAFAPYFASLAQAQSNGVLADFPLPYLVGVLRWHLDFTVASDLTPTQRAAAFDLAWRAITKS